jgi:UDP-N-acetylglucosamine 2-epimerase (non-hydrolysing)
MKVLVPFGTRPEIVKLAPVVDELRARGHDVHAVATGQHDDPLLADAFFTDLGLEPDERWSLPDGESSRVGALLAHAYDAVAGSTPDLVLVLGDTYTVPLFGLAARRHGVPVAHLEAGLRSFNDRSLEEVNRRAVAAMTSIHLAPTELAARFLADEGHDPARVRMVGNPITDTLLRHGPARRAPDERHGIVVTAHRATNVDDPDRLARLIEIVTRLGAEVGSVRFPVHPRTRARLEAAGALDGLAGSAGVSIEDPLRYPEMLDAVATSTVVVTDSGGLQEEASWFGVPVVVLRSSTPRWEGVLDGTTRLVGLDVSAALDATGALTTPEAQAHATTTPCPYGDGHVAERVAVLLADPAVAPLLCLAEPDGTSGLPDRVRRASEP